jgi:hypothetical protein
MEACLALRSDLDRRCACFDKLSMRFFFVPQRFHLSLSLSKAAPENMQRSMR